jgi:ABC-type transporter Mla subunit MlaD
VADDDILARIDRHMERGNELIDQTRGALERNTAAFEDLRLFLREFLLRFDRVIEANNRRHEAFLESLAEQMRAETRATRAAMEATREESKAVVSGLLKVIDRLDRWEPGNGPAAA